MAYSSKLAWGGASADPNVDETRKSHTLNKAKVSFNELSTPALGCAGCLVGCSASAFCGQLQGLGGGT